LVLLHGIEQNISVGYNISFIGSGNVATNLAHELDKAGNTIYQVISSQSQHAQQLASKYGAYYSNDLAQVDDQSDFIILSVQDESYYTVLEELPRGLKSIICHTSGPVSIQVLSNYALNYGVFYPLQSMRKEEPKDFLDVPIFIEGNSESTKNSLFGLGKTISNVVEEVSSEEREKYHLAAVFANNFTNLMYSISHDYLHEEALKFEHLLPIIKETSDRLSKGSPRDWQTGPAKRGDIGIIQKHIDMLDSQALRDIYTQLSDYIKKM